MRESAREGGDLGGDVAGIVAHAHRRRSGVVRLAGERELGPGNALHAFDRADGEAFGLQHRPLFDMQLDIGMDVRPADRRVAGVTDPRRIRRRQTAPSIAIVASASSSDKRAGKDQAAEHVGLEARALLVGEERDGERSSGDDAGIIRAFRSPRGPARTPSAAVVAAAGAHRVDMASGHDRRSVLAALRGCRPRCRSHRS